MIKDFLPLSGGVLVNWPAEQIEYGVRLNTKRQAPTPSLLDNCISHCGWMDFKETKEQSRANMKGDFDLWWYSDVKSERLLSNSRSSRHERQMWPRKEHCIKGNIVNISYCPQSPLKDPHKQFISWFGGLNPKNEHTDISFQNVLYLMFEWSSVILPKRWVPSFSVCQIGHLLRTISCCGLIHVWWTKEYVWQLAFNVLHVFIRQQCQSLALVLKLNRTLDT